jgi:hypothetical protein
MGVPIFPDLVFKFFVYGVDHDVPALVVSSVQLT